MSRHISLEEIEKLEKLEKQLAKIENAFWTLVNILNEKGSIDGIDFQRVTEAHDA